MITNKLLRANDETGNKFTRLALFQYFICDILYFFALKSAQI